MEYRILKILTTLSILLLHNYIGWSQEIAPRPLTIEIIEDSVTCVSQSSAVSLSFKLRNDSNDDIIVYGVRTGRPFAPFFPLSELCDPETTGTGIAFGVFDAEHRHVRPEFEMKGRHDLLRVTDEAVDSLLNVVKQEFLNSAILIKSKAAIVFEKSIPLEDLNLKRGRYSLQLVYYSGDYTSAQLRVEGIGYENVFRGCVTSAKIPLLVK